MQGPRQYSPSEHWRGKMTIFEEVAAERKKQIANGYDAKHDDEHTDCSIADAAAQYASTRLLYYRPLPSEYEFERLWPWEDTSFPSPKLTHRQSLIIAISLCFAEIERLDRRETLERSMHLEADGLPGDVGTGKQP
jgi:hypothetical protein